MMRKVRRCMLMTLMFCLMMVNTIFGQQWNWNDYAETCGDSVLLAPEIKSAKDTVYKYGRGDYLAEGSVEIVDLANGQLELRATTLAHVNVDRILHSIFLDMWDADENDWICMNYWDFEITKEEVEDGQLHMFTSILTLSGYEVGRYYRVRGLHGVEIYDELEACATETHGVQLTDWKN